MATFFNQATLSYNNTTVNSNIVTGEIVETLSASKTAVDDVYSPGETITYVISLVNSGSSPVANVTVTDDLGAYTFGALTLIPLTYVEGSVRYFADGALQPDPAVTADGKTLVFSGITVPADGNAQLIYQASANEFAPPQAGSEIVNTASVASGTTEALTASATVTAESEALLSIDKALSPDEIAGGGQITYTFTIRNNGNAAVDTAVLTDTFDPALSDIAVTVGGTDAPAADYTYDEATGEFATVAGALDIPAATYTRDPETGAFSIVPGSLIVTVTGTI